jgi:uncharacterized protein YjhX (UPF0386 family)
MLFRRFSIKKLSVFKKIKRKGALKSSVAERLHDEW